MKNKVLIRAIIASLFAFMLYSANLRQLQHAKVNVIEPTSSKTNKKQQKEPKLKTPAVKKKTSGNNNEDVTVEKGSQKSLVQTVEKVMGNESYQVAVQDLNNSSRYARLNTNSGSQKANGVLRLLILTAIYKEEQSGKLKPHTNIKIKKADRQKGEKLLQTHMSYGIAYLRQAMMHGNKTAANALLRKLKLKEVNQIAKKFETDQTSINQKFTQSPVGSATADDLNLILKGLYQGKVLNRTHAQLALMGMHGSRTKLTSAINGTIYSVGDKNFATAIVQSNGHSYCISVWSKSNQKFKALGKAVNRWFIKNH